MEFPVGLQVEELAEMVDGTKAAQHGVNFTLVCAIDN